MKVTQGVPWAMIPLQQPVKVKSMFACLFTLKMCLLSGCSAFKEKSYCCQSGTGPQCFYTGCSRETSCPGNYRELDRTKSGCSGFAVNAYCCKTTNLPLCFDLSCPAFAESAKSCPPEYRETKRLKGRSAGCDSAFVERITCCLRGVDSGNNRIQNSNINNDSEVKSETKTITLEDGTVQTVTRTQTHSKSTSGLFSNASLAAFLKILLLFPILAAIL